MDEPEDKKELLEVFAPTRNEGDKAPVELSESKEDEADEIIDEASDESFPASDPPAMPGSTSGSPKSKKR